MRLQQLSLCLVYFRHWLHFHTQPCPLHFYPRGCAPNVGYSSSLWSAFSFDLLPFFFSPLLSVPSFRFHSTPCSAGSWPIVMVDSVFIFGADFGSHTTARVASWSQTKKKKIWLDGQLGSPSDFRLKDYRLSPECRRPPYRPAPLPNINKGRKWVASKRGVGPTQLDTLYSEPNRRLSNDNF